MRDTLKPQFEAFADRYKKDIEAAFREGFRAGVDITSQMFVRPEQFTSGKALRHAENQAWCNYAKTKEKHG